MIKLFLWLVNLFLINSFFYFFFIFQYNKFIVNCFILLFNTRTNFVMIKEIQLGMLKCCM